MYEEILNKNQEFSGATGIVYLGNKIIVFKRDNKTKIHPMMFDLPGGGREEFINLPDAIIQQQVRANEFLMSLSAN